MTLQAGDFVAYAGRAGRVRGIETVDSAGPCLAIAVTAAPGGIVLVPVDRVAGTVERISEAQAVILDENPVDPLWRRLSKVQRQKQKALRSERLAEFGRLSGIARSKKRAA